MRYPLQRLLPISLILLTGCAPLTTVTLASTSTPTMPEAANTLPPAHTATEAPTATATVFPTPAIPDLDFRTGLLEGADRSNLDPESLTRYWIEIEVGFEPGGEQALIDGVAHIQFTNTTGEPLYDLVLRLWPNDPQYAARMTAGPAYRDGRALASELEVDDTVLRIPFSLPIEEGESISIDVPFQVEAGIFQGSDPRRFGITGSVLIAPTFYPLIPRRLGGDWEIEEAPPGGDTTNSETALYRVTIGAPAELQIAASGVEVDRWDDGDRQSMTIVTGPMRDFAFALGPFNEDVREVDGVQIRSWTLAEHEADVDTVLDSAALQFDLLSDMIGPYPYPELDIVDAPGAFGGIEYPGLVYIGTIGSPWVIEPTVHEIAHQWFYALVGDDQVDEPWLDEGAATFATALYYENSNGSGRGAGYLSSLRAAVRDDPGSELPIGLPVGAYDSVNEYAVIVYFKGALFFDALRQRLGERGFEAFLKAYYDKYRFKIADSIAFQSVAEEICACELDDFFDLWVYEGGEIPGLTD